MGLSFGELFAPLYAPLPDSGKYLERIGIRSVQNADRETLDALVSAHQSSVPFENLDVYDAETELSLNIPALYEKIVLRRRGGYCFELNGVFMALLQSLGYDCHAAAARVIWHATCTMPLSHRVTIVTIDGVRYFCDVGFGGPSPRGAILLDESAPQASGAHTFIFDKSTGVTVISRMVDGEPEPLLTFSESPCDQVDFLALNEYQSRNKNSKFKQARTLNLVTDTGSITLSENLLTINSNGNADETELKTDAELRGALKKHFGIEVDFKLRI